MSKPKTKIEVTSHVGRDLLQSSQVFKTEKHVIWEYVSNGLQYVDNGATPEVRVTMTTGKNKHIEITDNGRGMTPKDLKNFFVMHGENQERKAGRVGRGRFGTGKSAAFGIANCLEVVTVRGGLRTWVRLRRSDIEKMSEGAPIPVEILEEEVTTTEPNGTTVRISSIKKKTLDQRGAIGFIEKHIMRWPNANVWVNHHQCELEEPPIDREVTFSTESTIWEKQLGKVDLTVKVAKAPLDIELQGIAVLSGSVWHESTLAGLDRKDFSTHIFGEIDVPALDSDTSSPSPFDLSRSMQLNPENETVNAIHAFIGSKVSEVLTELAKEERKRKKTKEAQRLEQEASKIADIINKDFASFRDKLKKVKAAAPGSSDIHPGEVAGGAGEELLLPGGDLPADKTGETGPGSGDGTVDCPGENDYPRGEELVENPEGKEKAKKSPAKESAKTPRGGFSVEFRELGEAQPRAKYDAENRTILVNLDHPQVSAAKGSVGIDDPAFRRLAYEVAFTEYALGLAYVMDEGGHYIDPWEPIIDIRQTIDRVTRAAKGLYGAS